MGYNLTAEMFSEWAIGMAIIAIRLYARWKVGKGHFQWDDALLVTAAAFWTVQAVTLYLCTAVHSSNIGLNEKSAMEIPDDLVSDYRQGSLDAFIAWIAYIATVWAFKGVLVILYNRMTQGLWQHRLTLSVSAFTGASFLASIFVHIFGCMPIYKNWQVKPYAGDQCTLRPHNYIIIETLSVITDLAVMAVPIPLIIRAGISLRQKLLLCGLFSTGTFVMICALLRAYYSVQQIDKLQIALGWASREALVSAVTVCAPGIKPLVSNGRWFSRSSNQASGGFSSGPYGKSSNFKKTGQDSTAQDHFELSTSRAWGRSRRGSSGESQEHIVTHTNSEGGGSHSPIDDGILVTTDVMLNED